MPNGVTLKVFLVSFSLSFSFYRSLALSVAFSASFGRLLVLADRKLSTWQTAVIAAAVRLYDETFRHDPHRTALTVNRFAENSIYVCLYSCLLSLTVRQAKTSSLSAGRKVKFAALEHAAIETVELSGVFCATAILRSVNPFRNKIFQSRFNERRDKGFKSFCRYAGTD